MIHGSCLHFAGFLRCSNPTSDTNVTIREFVVSNIYKHLTYDEQLPVFEMAKRFISHVASLTSSLNLINKTMSGSFIPACNNWLLSNNMANQRLRNMLPRTTDNSREYT